MQNMQQNPMQGKNARQQVQDVYSQLQTAANNLNQAITSVEKPQNKQQIQDTLNAVNSAMQTANTTLTYYQE